MNTPNTEGNSVEDAPIYWELAARTLISLWDMIQFLPVEFHANLGHIHQIIGEFNTAPAGLLTDADKRKVESAVDTCARYCGPLKLAHAIERIEHIKLRAVISNASGDDSYHIAVAAQLQGLADSIITEIRKRTFMFIDRPELFEQEMLFGLAVAEKFPAAREDIKDAGTCLASGLNNAAVFHLMRALEHGLIDMAKRLKVKKPKAPSWGAYITAIQKEIQRLDASQNWPPSWQKHGEFFREASTHFKHFKSIRNNASHAGEHGFEADEAEIIFRHTREFMQHLAPKPKGRDGVDVARILFGKTKRKPKTAPSAPTA